MTVDLEKMVEAYHDISNAASRDGFTVEDMAMRFEMLDIEFQDFRAFLHHRLMVMSEQIPMDESFQKGYVHAALEFFLYGNLTGKEAALDMEILSGED
jgi:hypothetical protein